MQRDKKDNNEERKNNNEEKKLSSTKHTLFKKKIHSSEKANKKGLFKRVPGYTQYRFFVNDFEEFEKGLHDIYNELWNAGGSDKLELRINSNGGMVNEGAQFYSIIKNKFNGRTTTILDNKGYSMGALAFCMGDKRIVTERADLMFHDYSVGVLGKGGEIQARTEHTQVFIRKFFKEIIKDQGFLTKKEYENMLIGQDFWMNAEEMCKRGIATHVLMNGKEIKAKKYLKLLQKGNSNEKSKNDNSKKSK